MTRVAIAGGGLGGLAAAAFLHQAGVPAVVYEQARELREVGAGIMVPPNAARMLRRLGVLDEFRERAAELRAGAAPLRVRAHRPRKPRPAGQPRPR